VYTMDPRLDLQTLLETILGTDQVYFQPPASVQMEYPCIVYRRDSAVTQFAGNDPYRYTQRYQVTLISRNPDTDILGRVAAMRLCTYNRYFAANNLNHDVFELFF